MNNSLATIEANSLCQIPNTDADIGEFAALKLDERSLVRKRLDCIFKIYTAKNTCETAHKIAAFYEAQGEKGFSYKTLMRLYYAFLKSKDWRVLKHNWRGKNKGKPQEFINYFRELLLSSPRKDACKAARRELISRWMRGDDIPGYGTIVDWSVNTGRPIPKGYPRDNELPDGWSYSRLVRIKPKSKYALETSKRGFFAAHSYEPDMLLRDRSKLRFLEMITFDDVRIDNKCLVSMPGMKRQIGYPLGVLALDIATGCDIAHCVKPRIKREADASTFGIASEDVRYLILNIIETYGLPPYPITFVIENAAATLSRADELAITQTFGDRIRIHRCGLLKDKLTKNGFYETGGKPWCKGWIESFFQILQTQLSLLEGAAGNRYDNSPARLKQIEAYTKRLLRLTKGNDDILKKLAIPLLNFEEISDAILDVLRLLRFRTDHNLQGFETVTEWRKDKFDTIHTKDELKALSDEELSKAEIWDRRESPAERVMRLVKNIEFTKLPVAYYVHLFALKAEIKFEIRSGGLVFKSKDLKRHHAEKINDDLVFDAPALSIIEEYSGQSVLVYFDDDLSFAHITKEGKYICSCPRKNRVNIADESAIKRQSGFVSRRRLDDRNVISELIPSRDAKFREMKDSNFATLEAAGILNAKISSARERINCAKTAEQKDALKSLENFLDGGEDESSANAAFEQMQDFLE